MSQGVDIADEEMVHHQLVALIAELRERKLAAGSRSVIRFEPLQSERIHEDAVERVQKIVAGGPLNRPLLRQLLAAAQDFLHNHINAAGTLLHPAEITLWIPEPIDMVDPQTRHFFVSQELERFLMAVIEHFRRLDPERYQFCN